MPTPKEIAKGAVRMVALQPEEGDELQVNPAHVAYIKGGAGFRTVVGMSSGKELFVEDEFDDLRDRLVYIVPGAPPEM
jgi:uncharacterized protein YlzI (FlbEa/FlbD family)